MKLLLQDFGTYFLITDGAGDQVAYLAYDPALNNNRNQVLRDALNQIGQAFGLPGQA